MDTIFTIWYVGFLLTSLLFCLMWLKQGYKTWTMFSSGLFLCLIWPVFWSLVTILVFFGKKSS